MGSRAMVIESSEWDHPPDLAAKDAGSCQLCPAGSRGPVSARYYVRAGGVCGFRICCDRVNAVAIGRTGVYQRLLSLESRLTSAQALGGGELTEALSLANGTAAALHKFDYGLHKEVLRVCRAWKANNPDMWANIKYI
jgi:hypothetical protein